MGCRSSSVVILALVVLVASCTGQSGIPETTGPGITTSEVSTPLSTTPGAAALFGCEPDAQGHVYWRHPAPEIRLTPNPVEAGSRAILRVGPSWLLPGDMGVVGWGVRWECWNGSEWVQTHLLEHGRGPGAWPAIVDQEPGVPGTMPAVGIGVPDSFTITIPDVPPGWYQLRETVIGKSGTERYERLAVEVIAPGEAFSYDDVVSGLEAVGATVEEAGTAPSDPFTVEARLLDVEGHELRVYEYPDVVAQIEETATIAMEGWSVRNTPVEWIAAPHYWAKGRVIVLYLGDDARAQYLATRVLDWPLRLGPPPEPPPDWTFFGEGGHIEWIGDHVVNFPINRWNLGPRDVTLADGQVLHFPADDQRARWCWPVDPDVWSQDVDGCWIAGTVGENGEVSEWRAFKVSERWVQQEVVGYGFHTGMRIAEVVDGAAIVRGYPIPIAEDASVHLGCCPVRYTELEDVDDLDVWVFFDTERQEITDIQCLCDH